MPLSASHPDISSAHRRFQVHGGPETCHTLGVSGAEGDVDAQQLSDSDPAVSSPQAGPSRRIRNVALLIALLLFVSVLSYFTLPAPMAGDALVTSLGRQHRVDFAACYSPDDQGKRQCSLWSQGDPPGGAYVDSYFPAEDYEVVVSGRCWTARLTWASDVQPPMPSRLSDCIVLGDHVRLLGRFLEGDPTDRWELGPSDE